MVVVGLSSPDHLSSFSAGRPIGTGDLFSFSSGPVCLKEECTNICTNYRYELSVRNG